MGVQPEKKLVLLLRTLFFLFTNGIWFSWDSSSLMSREAAELGFLTNTSWSVISFSTCQKSKGDNLGVSHCPEASQLKLELGDQQKLPGQHRELLNFLTQNCRDKFMG